MSEQHLKITIQDLIIAYRKVKVDLYYSNTYLKSRILEYEENLKTNLENLCIKINSGQDDWLDDSEYFGDWYPIPSKIYAKKENVCEAINFKKNTVFSDQKSNWEQVKRENEELCAEFRIIANPGMDFQVLSSLWIMKVGHKFDQKLSECSYGNRLRRTEDGHFNLFSMGSFKPYLWQYKNWQDRSIDSMNESLRKDTPLVTLTTDIKGFYHHLNPDFILDKSFLQLVNVQLNESEIALTKLYISSIKEWAKLTPLGSGLPVGQPASALIANMALYELDTVIERELIPIYYGRYVDDIILVFKNSPEFKTQPEVWDFIISRTNSLIVQGDDESYIYKTEYLNGCNISFSEGKTKVFFLKGSSGISMVKTIRSRLNERSSEWRAVPTVSEDPLVIETKIVEIHQRNQEILDSFRKADFLSLNRSEFALIIRDFEAYSRDLKPESWRVQRKAFINAFINNTILPTEFFSYEKYLYRIISLICVCGDFEELFEIIDKLGRLVTEIERTCSISIKAFGDGWFDETIIMTKWRNWIHDLLEDTILSSISSRQVEAKEDLWNTLVQNNNLIYSLPSKVNIVKSYKRYLNRDLAVTPFRFQFLEDRFGKERNSLEDYEILYCNFENNFFAPSIIEGLDAIRSSYAQKIKNTPFAFYFSTRPFNISELVFLIGLDERDKIDLVLNAFRGYKIADHLPKKKDENYLIVENYDLNNKVKIALANWEAKEDYLVNSIKNAPTLSFSRYTRLNNLVNSVLKQDVKPNYVIMPELAIPSLWFMSISHRLRKNNISFISGVEYIHKSKKRVSNQVWCSLINKTSEFPFEIVFKRDKQKAALHEECELFKISGVKLDPEEKREYPQIIKHGDFCFSILICSELTNIEYRSFLRGKIDALFVPEWNQDLDSFNALVESAALDIHAYIVQCNNRRYGDSRIRVPHKDSWKRDAVRSKGGLNDYVVIGEIDIKSLRKFQNNYRSPDRPFKPMPDGFEIGKFRGIISEDNDQGGIYE